MPKSYRLNRRSTNKVRAIIHLLFLPAFGLRFLFFLGFFAFLLLTLLLLLFLSAFLALSLEIRKHSDKGLNINIRMQHCN